MWERLVARHTLNESTAENDILICDTAADQCTITKKAWHINERTERIAACKGHISKEQKKMNIVSGYAIAYGEGLLPALIKVNEGMLNEEDGETKSLFHPYQAMEFGYKFNLTPTGCEDCLGSNGQPGAIVNDLRLPFEYDGRKLFMNLRKPTKKELDTMIPVVLTSLK